MALELLSISGLRNLSAVELKPGSGLNWLSGENGAGKTSVLEAIYLLARGRSFRSARMGAVIQHGSDCLRVVARRADDQRRLGMERSTERWRGRIDGIETHRLSEFAQALPLVLMEPDSHRLIDSGPEGRRQYLDWQLFHVEPGYLEVWRRYARLLKQRNAALKMGSPDSVLSAIEAPMIQAGESLNDLRQRQVDAIFASVQRLATQLALRLPGGLDMSYKPGHPKDQALAEALPAFRDRDRELGFTRRGPHRADLVLNCAGRAAAEELSRGQQKLLALLLLLAQLRLVVEASPVAPLLMLDDPVSELDAGHLGTLLDWVRDQPVQTWVTATQEGPSGATVFHVEQGKIRPVV
ncbi:MAG: DNA replication/repair protein RecF [Wenzhouxiangella sp.]